MSFGVPRLRGKVRRQSRDRLKAELRTEAVPNAPRLKSAPTFRSCQARRKPILSDHETEIFSLVAPDFFHLRSAAAMPKFDMPQAQEPKIPNRTASITDFAAVPDGKTLNTEAIAKGIAALAEKGGGRLIVPPGLWLTGPIGLKSHVELHLEEGALVLFSPDHSLYPPIQLDMKGRRRTVTTSPIHGENLEDIAITGKGVMDGSGDAGVR